MDDKKPPITPDVLPDDPEQSKRFIDMAREVEVDETPGAFDRAFEKVLPRQKRSSVIRRGNPGIQHKPPTDRNLLFKLETVER